MIQIPSHAAAHIERHLSKIPPGIYIEGAAAKLRFAAALLYAVIY